MTEFLSETARRLRAQSAEILRRWEVRVLAEVPAASTVDADVLRDHLHVLLAEVVTALGPGVPDEFPAGLTISEQHGAERAVLEGYSLGEVLQEYSVLRKTVLEALDEGTPMSFEERQIINDALEQALIGASSHFALVQHRAEHTLTEAARSEAAALLEADQHKNVFLAWLAHELRTPLSTITHALYILDNLELEDPRATKQIATASRQTRHLSRLVEDLIDLSRISRGSLEMRLECLDLRQSGMEAAEASRPLMDEHGQEFACSFDEAPLWVQGDSVRLVQTITNLLNNAARYGEDGGRVSLSVRREEDEAVVRVEDTGIGIAPEALPRIFEPFVQEESASPQSQKGLGIGLALVRRLVEMHGGSVAAHSRGRGQGAEFVARVPLTQPPGNADASAGEGSGGFAPLAKRA